jgi:nucleoside-diphosphate-sugar epimerase
VIRVLHSTTLGPILPPWQWLLHHLASGVTRLEASGPLRLFSVRRRIKMALDGASGILAVLVTFWLRTLPPLRGLPLVALAVGAGILLALLHAIGGSYRSIWRYTGFAEAGVVALSSLATMGMLLTLGWIGVVPMSLSSALLASLLILFLCGGIRAIRRWQVAESKRVFCWPSAGPPPSVSRRVLIAGAGERGLSVARDIIAVDLPGVELIGFLDDDRTKIGATPCGRPVLGPLTDVLTIAERYEVNEVIAAMPSTSPEQIRAFSRELEQVGIRVRVLRDIASFVSGRDIHRPGRATYSELVGSQRATHDGNESSADEEVRRVLVTGGAGYIGSHLTRLLLDRGYHVRVLDRLDYGRAGLVPVMNHPRLEVVTGDVCDSHDVSRAMRHVDSVFALAAIVGDPACNLDPEETINLNYSATKILIETANFYGIRRLIFASSCSVYGANNDGLLNEDSRLNPVSLYARTRVLSENILFGRCGDVEPVVLRLATVFGVSPRMRFDLVVNTLTARALMDGEISIFGGNQWRPNVHCRDVARAFVLALEAPTRTVAGEIFNVGGDTNNHRIDELGEMVAAAIDNVTVTREGDVSDPRDYRVTFAKIRGLLGFEPEYSVPAGIREIIAAVQCSPALRDYQDPIYHNVHQLKRAFETPRRRCSDFPVVPRLVES